MSVSRIKEASYEAFKNGISQIFLWLMLQVMVIKLLCQRRLRGQVLLPAHSVNYELPSGLLGPTFFFGHHGS